jgi:hypothetical protein
MSHKHSTAIGAALGGAAIAAFVGMGTAHADVTDTYYDSLATIDPTQHPDDAYDILFGAAGTTAGTQGFENNALDVSTAESNLPGYESFTTAVTTFEETAGTHGLENLIYAVDPSAFYAQSTEGIAGTLNAAGDYLVPDDFLGYLATGLDYGLLTPTGLDFVLTPLIDALLGQTPGV